MRNRDVKQLGASLAAATCALLGNSAQAATTGDQGWKFDSAVLFYNEQSRVNAVEPEIQGARQLPDDSEIKLKVTLDTLTGASHNGAITAAKPQTFTSPSGNATYGVAPGDLPLDKTFHDSRAAGNLQYTHPLNRTLRWTAGVNLSSEYDFKSLGLNGGWLWDLNNKNTTLGLSFSHESDSIKPVGGVPMGLTIQSAMLKKNGSESRHVEDALLGLTQVINRRWIMQLNYNLSVAKGYQTDPYKVVTVVDANGDPLEAENLPAPFAGPDIGPGDAQLYELRPDSRTKHAIYWENRFHFEKGVLAVGYRHMTDDWGIKSNTVDLKYRLPLGQNWYLQPHARWYKQSAADFYRQSITQADLGSLKHVSADYRLGKLKDTTFGLKLARHWGDNRELSFRLESFRQSGDRKASDLNATIAQVGYTISW